MLLSVNPIRVLLDYFTIVECHCGCQKVAKSYFIGLVFECTFKEFRGLR